MSCTCVFSEKLPEEHDFELLSDIAELQEKLEAERKTKESTESAGV